MKNKINKLKKIGLYICVLIGIAILVNALDINISPSLEPEYTTTTTPLQVVISDSYDSWKYSVTMNQKHFLCVSTMVPWVVAGL